MSPSPAILHVFTSAESAADPSALAIITAQKEQNAASASISTLTLTADNTKEALAAIFAADSITTWPGTRIP